MQLAGLTSAIDSNRLQSRSSARHCGVSGENLLEDAVKRCSGGSVHDGECGLGNDAAAAEAHSTVAQNGQVAR